MYLYLIQKFTQILVVNLLNLLQQQQLLNLQHQVRELRRKILGMMAMSLWICLCCTSCYGADKNQAIKAIARSRSL